jgi:hypothetical protein
MIPLTLSRMRRSARPGGRCSPGRPPGSGASSSGRAARGTPGRTARTRSRSPTGCGSRSARGRARTRRPAPRAASGRTRTPSPVDRVLPTVALRHPPLQAVHVARDQLRRAVGRSAVQPVLIYAADRSALTRAFEQAITRNVEAVYAEEMFTTGDRRHDAPSAVVLHSLFPPGGAAKWARIMVARCPQVTKEATRTRRPRRSMPTGAWCTRRAAPGSGRASTST